MLGVIDLAQDVVLASVAGTRSGRLLKQRVTTHIYFIVALTPWIENFSVPVAVAAESVENHLVVSCFLGFMALCTFPTTTLFGM